MRSFFADIPLAGRNDPAVTVRLGVLDNDDRLSAVDHLAVQKVPDGTQISTDRAAFPLVRTTRNESRPLDAVTVVLHADYITGMTVKCQGARR